MTYKVSPLPFAYDALEPYIDAGTMELHHDQHHQTYVDHLNTALEPYPELADLAIEDLLARLGEVPDTVRTAVRNHGGGHVNHQSFWEVLGPGAGDGPKGAIADALTQQFGSSERFQCSSPVTHPPVASRSSRCPIRTACRCTANPNSSAATSGSTRIT